MCKELNPCDVTRNWIVRKGDWVKVTIRQLRSEISVVNNNFTRSGNQDAENMPGDWVNFCNGSEILMYAFAVWPTEERDQLGKVVPGSARVPEVVNLDTESSPEDATIKKHKLAMTPAAVAKRKQRQMRRELLGIPSGSSVSTKSSQSPLGKRPCEAPTDQYIKLQALKFCSTGDFDDETKEKAKRNILELAGLN